MTAGTRKRSGMTLMELVIALAITGLMAASGAAAFGSIIDHRKTIRDASVSTERAGALREMLSSWINAGQIRLQVGGVPRGLGARVAGAALASQGGSNVASVSAAQADGDELRFTTTALNPSLMGNVAIRLYVDADANTPEKGLTIEYQPNLQQPLVRKMLDSTVDTLRVEFLDARTNRWIDAAQVSTITPRAARVTLLSSKPSSQSRILGLPMIFTNGFQAANNNRVAVP
jgi:prepilin-type N-terminal cleavage/methylation domain-containing protein